MGMFKAMMSWLIEILCAAVVAGVILFWLYH